MSTLPIRATQTWVLPRLSRVAALVAIAFDAFAEAQRQARDADARYRFVE